MITLRWIIVILLGGLSGVLLMRYLVVPPLSMASMVLLLAAALGGLAWFTARTFHGRDLLFAALLAAAVFAGGYAASTLQFLAQEEHRDLPVVRAGQGAGEGGHTAVIYLTHGEPPGYSPMPWIETFHEFDKDGVPFIPTIFRPFFFHGLRTEYLKTGGSPHNFVHEAMRASLEGLLRAEGDQETRVYLSFLDSNPRPDEMAIRAVNDGASRVVISYVFLTKSSHTLAGEELVDAVDLPQHGVEVCKTQPLWDSPHLQQMFVERANRALGGTEKSKVGILLVGHGQPDAWDKVYVTQTTQEQQFREEVMERLVADGFEREHISLAWMEFKAPEPGEKARELAEKAGVEKILVFSASISAPSLHSEYDTPEAVRAARLPPGVEVVNLGAWGDDPLVIQAIREKLRDCGL